MPNHAILELFIVIKTHKVIGRKREYWLEYTIYLSCHVESK